MLSYVPYQQPRNAYGAFHVPMMNMRMVDMMQFGGPMNDPTKVLRHRTRRAVMLAGWIVTPL